MEVDDIEIKKTKIELTLIECQLSMEYIWKDFFKVVIMI